MPNNSMFQKEKDIFAKELKKFADKLADCISTNDEWNIRGFIDIFKNVYSISSDTKIVSKIVTIQNP